MQQPTSEIAKKQSQGLKGAVITVRRAYLYTNGYSYHTPKPGWQLIATDVEFANLPGGLDLDDIEIIDAISGDSYGSFPEFAFLDEHGEFLSWNKAADPQRPRILFVWVVPKQLNSIKLSYWGQELTPQPIPLADRGPALPEPRKQ